LKREDSISLKYYILSNYLLIYYYWKHL